MGSTRPSIWGWGAPYCPSATWILHRRCSEAVLNYVKLRLSRSNMQNCVHDVLWGHSVDLQISKTASEHLRCNIQVKLLIDLRSNRIGSDQMLYRNRTPPVELGVPSTKRPRNQTIQQNITDNDSKHKHIRLLCCNETSTLFDLHFKVQQIAHRENGRSYLSVMCYLSVIWVE